MQIKFPLQEREERVAMSIPAARYDAIAQLFCLNNLLTI